MRSDSLIAMKATECAIFEIDKLLMFPTKRWLEKGSAKNAP